METIELELSVAGSTYRVFDISKRFLPELVSEITVVTHLGRTVETPDQSVYRTIDRWEIDVLKPLPGFISRFLTFQVVRARSEIDWQKDELRSTWSITVPDMEDLLEECRGIVKFLNDGEETLLVLEGQFDLDLSAVPGIPNFLASYLRGRQASVAKRVIRQYLPRFKEKIESTDNAD